MLRNVKLYGHLEEEFGRDHQFDVSSPAETIRALAANYPKFLQKLKKGYYVFVKGETLESGRDLPVEELKMNFGKDDFHLCPVIEGSKSGWLNVILGVILIIVGVIVSAYSGGAGTPLIQLGIGLMISGIVQLLTPVPGPPPERNNPDERPSFVFTGPVNTSEQGGPIPICYGEFIIGSTIISAAIEVVETA
jgi:predicted phage tail protein